MYLDDLNHDEPEIAELYLYSRHRTTYVMCPPQTYIKYSLD